MKPFDLDDPGETKSLGNSFFITLKHERRFQAGTSLHKETLSPLAPVHGGK